MKQQDVAKLVGIDPAYFSRILAGKQRPSVKLALKLEELTKINRSKWLWADPVEVKERFKTFQFKSA